MSSSATGVVVAAAPVPMRGQRTVDTEHTSELLELHRRRHSDWMTAFIFGNMYVPQSNAGHVACQMSVEHSRRVALELEQRKRELVGDAAPVAADDDDEREVPTNAKKRPDGDAPSKFTGKRVAKKIVNSAPAVVEPPAAPAMMMPRKVVVKKKIVRPLAASSHQ